MAVWTEPTAARKTSTRPRKQKKPLDAARTSRGRHRRVRAPFLGATVTEYNTEYRRAHAIRCWLRRQPRRRPSRRPGPPRGALGFWSHARNAKYPSIRNCQQESAQCSVANAKACLLCRFCHHLCPSCDARGPCPSTCHSGCSFFLLPNRERWHDPEWTALGAARAVRGVWL